jgi:hypothetical protein
MIEVIFLDSGFFFSFVMNWNEDNKKIFSLIEDDKIIVI